MTFTVLQLKETSMSVRVHLVENTELWSPSGVIFLALLLTQEMTLIK